MGKSGFKSSEWWLNVAAFLAGAIMAAMGEPGGMGEIIGSIMMMIAPASYGAGRSSIKKSEALGLAHVEAARELAKKPDPKS